MESNRPIMMMMHVDDGSATNMMHPLLCSGDWDPSPAFSNPGSHDHPVWCSWSGVKCNPITAQVTSLDLSFRNLSGIIPPELRFLTSLVDLNLSRNYFDGPLQPAIFELTQLRTLDISHNSFNATFPPGVSKLKFLKFFNGFSNDFIGPLPLEFIHLQFLEQLNLGGSYFEGVIPVGYGNFKRLKFLDLAGNALEGTLPPQLGFLTQVEHIEIGYNGFTGKIPVELALLSNLKYLDISNCSLSGLLPEELGNLTKLEALYFFKNNFVGEIPMSYTKLKALKVLDLSNNLLSGTIPEELASLTELTWLSLIGNNFSGTIPQSIGELPNLNTLLLWDNNFSGILPQKLGSNGKLLTLDVSSNSLTGPLPPNLCHGNKLFKLILFNNMFTNELPRSLVNCTSLSRFRIQNNLLNGTIPYGFGLLRNLTFVDASKNKFTGEIPGDLGYAPMLQYLNISENDFNNELPSNIWSAPSLQIFSASSSKLTGEIPDFVDCNNVYKIELQGNFLNGSIPGDIDRCQKLLSLNLSSNLLTGIIPRELSMLPSINAVDLSHNLLTGTIPSSFENCSTLENFDVSYNLLSGPIPSSGPTFPNLHPSSFSGNDGLCGRIVAKPCPEALATGDMEAGNNNQQHPPRKAAGAIIGPWKLTAFQRLNFTSDDVLECLSMTDKIIGMGSTGTVYKAEMPSGETIAVKKLWGKHKETVRRRRGVLAEVEVLGNVRHRNIVRLLGCCSNRECTMLLYEYMPNGNLDDLLHGKNKGDNLVADWVTRYKIALGVAQGICYLHHDCDPLIQSDESMSVIAGSYGYIAPGAFTNLAVHFSLRLWNIANLRLILAQEYAYTLQVDEKSDIYSFGVVLMEIISGKRSVESEFGDGHSIVDWVRSKIKNKDRIVDVLDKNVGATCASVREEMMQMLRIALLCTSCNPAERPSMRDVVLMLQEAKPKRKLPAEGGGGGVNGSNVVVVGIDDSIAQKAKLEC
ncbi:hypothetical protein Gotri_027889 [Gossypium trilobum]|uniref:non-specific serine/threonine protein kinase n=1 Tax=Gossypium trilobum TaxID=34281 RepID=A0A7J9FVZ2_9ROSI|nr:hypothetical protein [Gossypium trilobum]